MADEQVNPQWQELVMAGVHGKRSQAHGSRTRNRVSRLRAEVDTTSKGSLSDLLLPPRGDFINAPPKLNESKYPRTRACQRYCKCKLVFWRRHVETLLPVVMSGHSSKMSSIDWTALTR